MIGSSHHQLDFSGENVEFQADYILTEFLYLVDVVEKENAVDALLSKLVSSINTTGHEVQY